MTTRRDFLRQLVGASTGLLVGGEALEVYERLTWKRRVWTGWGGGDRAAVEHVLTSSNVLHDLAYRIMAEEIRRFSEFSRWVNALKNPPASLSRSRAGGLSFVG